MVKYHCQDQVDFLFTFHQILYTKKFIFIIFKIKCEKCMGYIGTLGLLTLVFITGVYFACFFYVLKSHLKRPESPKIFFMIWCIAVGITYIPWILRIALLDANESNTALLYPYWAFCYAFGALSLISLDGAVLNLSPNRESLIFKILAVIIALTFISVIIVLIMGFNVDLVLFMGFNDLKIGNIFVYIYFISVIVFYITLPNAIFISFLIKNRSEKDFAYKRVRIIEIGIIMFSIGIALDGMRFPSDIGIFIARVILLIGGLFVAMGFFMKQGE